MSFSCPPILAVHTKLPRFCFPGIEYGGLPFIGVRNSVGRLILENLFFVFFTVCLAIRDYSVGVTLGIFKFLRSYLLLVFFRVLLVICFFLCFVGKVILSTVLLKPFLVCLVIPSIFLVKAFPARVSVPKV